MKTNQEIAIKQRILLHQRKKQKRNQAKKIKELRNKIKKMKTRETHPQQVRCQKKMSQKKILLERICQPVTRELLCYI